jgi:class 3 adenylate cyclase/tetratricopeptide (TPR) repeat protein
VPVCASCGRESRDGARFCEACGAALSAPPPPAREQRKTVTVLFCDLTGSTALGEALDPERLRSVLAAYFERMKSIVERHGGTVEKFIGDAVMAVFGVPLLHEDDALRAVRAAAEMRDALPGLGLHGRIGVMTGEVVTGTEERLATGDAVNVAARLEQAAPPGEVLIGRPTFALVRGSADVEPVEPLALKGKAEPVPAYRLLHVRDAPERRHDASFVGRERELAVVRDAWERVRAGRQCELVTVVGEAGVGKSRLAAELVGTFDASVVRGRCLPYGEGITYWAVVEVLKQLDLLPPDEAAAGSIRALVGETDAATTADEIAWAFRKTLEHAARDRPLVVLFDDIQWGEETFLDLVEHVALLSSGAPILLLCLARPDLVERRPAWPDLRERRDSHPVTLRLEPLAADLVHRLIPESVEPGLRERIVRAAGGIPLFAEEMVAMAAETAGHVVVPPNLQALLAARLDQLETGERGVLERGAVEGETFHRGAVQALAAGDAQVSRRLAGLLRKQLIGPDKAVLAGEDGFRFRHLLIRDAAYDSLSKALRADLHERFARWLEERGAELVELDEILGYHLEQAVLYRAELGLPDERDLAAEARSRLAVAARRADARQDYRAAARLYERAASLIPAGATELELETDLARALFEIGRADEARSRTRSLGERAAAAGNRVDELCARIQEAKLRMFVDPEGASEAVAALVPAALPVFEAAGDDVALFLAYMALADVASLRGQMDATLEATEQALVHAQRAGRLQTFVGWRATARLFGTTPVTELLAWLDEHELPGRWQQSLRRDRAQALAMLGRFDEARSILDEVRAKLSDRGAAIALATTTSMAAVEVELLAGDPAAAAALGEEGCALLEELGTAAFLSTAAATLAQALYAAGRLDDAEAWASRAAELGSSDDVATEMLWRQAKAKVLARRGDHGEAERLAREAVARGEQTDVLEGQGGAHLDLAEVLALAGRPGDAAEALERALERFERKGSVVSAQRARGRLAELRQVVAG